MPRTIFENIVIQHIENASAIAFCQYTPIRFFEILFIEKGSGTLIINDHKVPYSDNQLFVFIPNDKYNFSIETPTSVSAIKFLNQFFNHYSLGFSHQQKEWFRKIETILHGANRVAAVNIMSPNEMSSLQSLFTVLCNEYNDKVLKNEQILKATLHAILHIIARNINFHTCKSADSKIQGLINYIHNHIYESEKLTKKALAASFFLSENYISQFFKREMAIGLKKYILNYKLKLAETRLSYTDLTVTEIAQELGFTDSSHLDKTFLAYKGITVGVYRNRAQTVK